MKRIRLLSLLSAVLFSACGTATTPGPAIPAFQPTTSAATSAPSARTLSVFAAASLTQAFGEIGATFEASHPGVKVTFNFGGSQTLQAQIEGGAPADVFASANGANMDALVSEGFIDKAAPQILVTNVLQVILPPSNPAKLQALRDLARQGVKLDLADPSVPAGKYARQILDNLSKDPAYGADFGARVLANVVSNEADVKQVVAKVELGEADAGIAYFSDAVAAPDLKTIDIPTNFNVIAKYPIAPVLKSPHGDLAAEFVAYVLSADGQATLKKWGFTPIN